MSSEAPELDAEGRLPCGALLDDLLEQAIRHGAEPRTDHQRECPHCRAALVELDRLWHPVRAIAAEAVTVPAHLTRVVMDQVRRLAETAWHVVIPASRGVTQIAGRVVGVLAQLAANRVPGVRAALGRSTAPRTAAAAELATRSHTSGGSAVGVAGSSAAVDLAIAVEYGTSIADAADQVRAAVARELSEIAGISDLDLSIVVDDVLYDAE